MTTKHGDLWAIAERYNLEIFERDGKWWWWSCSPGCLPDSEETGPFDTEYSALVSATDGLEDDGE